MSPALVLTVALVGGHDYCPTGFPAYSTYYYSAPYTTTWYPAGGYTYRSAYGPSAPYAAPQQGYGAAGGYGYGQQGRRGAPIVYMTDRARFEPAQITVNVGETVEWRNTSGHAHTVTADPELARNPAHVVLPEGAQTFHSGEVTPGQRYAYRFDTPGTYYYVCLPHEEQGMVGIVVVKPPPGRGPGAGYERGAPAPGSQRGAPGAGAGGGRY